MNLSLQITYNSAQHVVSAAYGIFLVTPTLFCVCVRARFLPMEGPLKPVGPMGGQ